MRIFVTAMEDIGLIKSMFKCSEEKHTVELLPQNIKLGLKGADLLVIPGGDDIFPEFYGNPAPKRGIFDRERDSREIDTVQYAMSYYQVKMLGICRGFQLLNVAFGGNLYYDIPSAFGHSHKNPHPLTWKFPCELKDIFPEVNSLHHQAVRRISDGYTYKVMAVEPTTNTVEAVLWRNRVLGVQFHPEYMDKTFKIPFVNLLERWVKEDIAIDAPAKKETKKINEETVSTAEEYVNIHKWFVDNE